MGLMCSVRSPGDSAVHFVTAALSLFASGPLNGSTRQNLHVIERMTLVKRENNRRGRFARSGAGIRWCRPPGQHARTSR